MAIIGTYNTYLIIFKSSVGIYLMSQVASYFTHIALIVHLTLSPSLHLHLHLHLILYFHFTLNLPLQLHFHFYLHLQLHLRLHLHLHPQLHLPLKLQVYLNLHFLLYLHLGPIDQWDNKFTKKNFKLNIQLIVNYSDVLPILNTGGSMGSDNCNIALTS